MRSREQGVSSAWFLRGIHDVEGWEAGSHVCLVWGDRTFPTPPKLPQQQFSGSLRWDGI
jgi:hypothetical protein